MGQTEVAPACLHQKTPLLFSGSQRVCQVFLVTRKEKNYHCNQVIFIAWPKSSDLWCEPVLKKLHKAEGGWPTVSKFVPARARLPFAFLLTHLLCPLDTIPRAAFQRSGSLSSKAVLWLGDRQAAGRTHLLFWSSIWAGGWHSLCFWRMLIANTSMAGAIRSQKMTKKLSSKTSRRTPLPPPSTQHYPDWC